jgi:hypothetical protein
MLDVAERIVYLYKKQGTPPHVSGTGNWKLGAPVVTAVMVKFAVVQASGGVSDTGTSGGGGVPPPPVAPASPAANNALMKIAATLDENLPRMMLRMAYLPQKKDE